MVGVGLDIEIFQLIGDNSIKSNQVIDHLKKSTECFWQGDWIKIDVFVSEYDTEIINEADKKHVDCDK